MPKEVAFLAYPNSPPELGATIEAARMLADDRLTDWSIRSWAQNDIAGYFLSDKIFSGIDEASLLIADITYLNFNVVYEIGYAIGAGKRVFLIKSRAIQGDIDIANQVGIFDTLGWKDYANATELSALLSGIQSVAPLALPTKLNTNAPLYLLLPREKTDDEIRLISRVKKSRIRFRSFDPEESGRLAAPRAIEAVGTSIGVIVPFLPPNRVRAQIHNLRAAFVAGLAVGMDKLYLFLQRGEAPIPLDYRDFVKTFYTLSQLDTHIADFVPDVYERMTSVFDPTPSQKNNLLARVSLGASAAENEFSELGQYYLRTEEFERVLRGEVQVVVGRKGSGKTALFGQLRDILRRDRQRLVLDLKPEGFRLLQFKELVLDRVQQGTKEHVMTAFWEYLLLLETCHKILEKDRTNHINDHRLTQPYRELVASYSDDAFVSEGDFAERMSRLLDRIATDFDTEYSTDKKHSTSLTASQVTSLLYKHDIAKLRGLLAKYLAFKNGLWILFDNLDKGWPPHGLTPEDVTSFRALLDAINKLQNLLRNKGQTCVGVVFVRNDVYEWLIRGSSDRGKISHVLIDWSDDALLKEILKRRLAASVGKDKETFENLWHQVCVSHIRGEETSQYLIDRCLMRPRGLIDLVQFCRSRALNLGRDRIEIEDIQDGEEAYSTELITNLGYEIRDVFPKAKDILYHLLGKQSWLNSSEIDAVLESAGVDSHDRVRALQLLLWYGVIGVVRPSTGEGAYIYSVKYDLNRLLAIAESIEGGKQVYVINQALWAGLEINT